MPSVITEPDLQPRPGRERVRFVSRRRSLLALTLLVPASSLGVLASMAIWPGPVGQALYSLAKLWLLALPLVWLVLVERRAMSWSRPRRGGFAVGAATGVFISAAIVLGYWFVGRSLIDQQQMRDVAAGNGLDEPMRYLALVAYLVLINSVLEEYVWRWFVFEKLEEAFSRLRYSGAIAVTGSALLFALHHFIALKLQFGWLVTLIGTLGVAVGGVTWSWLYLRYRSVWPAYLSHAIVDIAVFIVGWWILFG